MCTGTALYDDIARSKPPTLRRAHCFGATSVVVFRLAGSEFYTWTIERCRWNPSTEEPSRLRATAQSRVRAALTNDLCVCRMNDSIVLPRMSCELNVVPRPSTVERNSNVGFYGARFLRNARNNYGFNISIPIVQYAIAILYVATQSVTRIRARGHGHGPGAGARGGDADGATARGSAVGLSLVQSSDPVLPDPVPSFIENEIALTRAQTHRQTRVGARARQSQRPERRARQDPIFSPSYRVFSPSFRRLIESYREARDGPRPRDRDNSRTEMWETAAVHPHLGPGATCIRPVGTARLLVPRRIERGCGCSSSCAPHRNFPR